MSQKHHKYNKQHHTAQQHSDTFLLNAALNMLPDTRNFWKLNLQEINRQIN